MLLSTLKHLDGCHGNQSVPCDPALDKLSEKLNNTVLVEEEHGFQKEAQCAPPWTLELQKSLVWIGLNTGLDRVKHWSQKVGF